MTPLRLHQREALVLSGAADGDAREVLARLGRVGVWSFALQSLGELFRRVNVRMFLRFRSSMGCTTSSEERRHGKSTRRKRIYL